MVDYRCWNKYGDEGLNEAEMRDSYLEREIPTSDEEDHDNDVDELDILGFTNDDIEFQSAPPPSTLTLPPSSSTPTYLGIKL
jgi:hypothetical protein